MNDLFSIKNNHKYVGRCATAIYLILKTEGLSGGKVLYPANICYAAVYPAIYAGCEPVFCDIDPVTGNIDFESFCKEIENVRVAVIPHMFGNPIENISDIADACSERGVLLIEDVASAMGATVDGRLCGSFGDYSVFSTGYAKTIDLGRGGIIFSDRSMEDLYELYMKLPEKTDEASINDSFFSKLYRLIRNNPEQTLDKYIWKNLSQGLKSSYLFKDSGIDRIIDEGIKGLSDVIETRRKKTALYDSYLKNISSIEIYNWNEGSVPWRYNLFADHDTRGKIISHLLDKNLPVSDWYPDVSRVFGIESDCRNALEFGNRIINLPLLIPDEEIEEICNCVTLWGRG